MFIFSVYFVEVVIIRRSHSKCRGLVVYGHHVIPRLWCEYNTHQPFEFVEQRVLKI
jgi:hypothetical protein